jgi:three-Cys-motif partner protein
MSEPTTTTWPLQPHTATKHLILRKYLNAWLPIITRWNGRVIFCDGFAGPGLYDNGEDGSPIIALKALLEHYYLPNIRAEIHYLFIEENKERCRSLEAVIANNFKTLPSNVTFEVVNDTYEEAFTRLLDALQEQAAKLAPTLAFIDPFGIKGLPLSTIVRLMEHKRCEVFINIMFGFIHRFLASPEFEPHCDALFGTREWREAVSLEGDAREQFLRRLYHRQLLDPHTGVGAKYVRYFTMKDHRNRTIYDLFFATNSYKGIDAMKDAMWSADQSGGATFSDATNPAQEVLFSQEPDWRQLIDLLVQQFQGATVRWPEVAEAIRQTPFLIRKTPVKQAAKGEAPRLRIINPPSARANVIDEGTRIQFL